MTERLFLNHVRNYVIKESELLIEYKNLKQTDCKSFDQWLTVRCSRQGDLDWLRKDCSQLIACDADNANNARVFADVLKEYCDVPEEDLGCTITITIDGHTLETYDNAVLLNHLIEAVNDLADDLEENN